MNKFILWYLYIPWDSRLWTLDGCTCPGVVSYCQGHQLTKVRRDASAISSGHRWLLRTYVNDHAVRKGDIAKACGDAFLRRRLRSGVQGKGRYRTWTPQGMLRASFLALWNCQSSKFLSSTISVFTVHQIRTYNSMTRPRSLLGLVPYQIVFFTLPCFTVLEFSIRDWQWPNQSWLHPAARTKWNHLFS